MSDPSNSGRKADGAFAKGNPVSRGKAKGTRHRTTLMAERLMADEAGAVVRATIRSALEGETAAQKLILDRIAPVRKGRPVPIALPEVTTAEGVLKALAEVVAAMARGEVSPDEAATIAGVVAAPKAIIEAQEMDRRIVELERRAQQVAPQSRSPTAGDES